MWKFDVFSCSLMVEYEAFHLIRVLTTIFAFEEWITSSNYISESRSMDLWITGHRIHTGFDTGFGSMRCLNGKQEFSIVYSSVSWTCGFYQAAIKLMEKQIRLRCLKRNEETNALIILLNS